MREFVNCECSFDERERERDLLSHKDLFHFLSGASSGGGGRGGGGRGGGGGGGSCYKCGQPGCDK